MTVETLSFGCRLNAYEGQVIKSEAEKAGLELDPVSGAELQKIVNEIVATPRPVADRLASIIVEEKK